MFTGLDRMDIIFTKLYLTQLTSDPTSIHIVAFIVHKIFHEIILIFMLLFLFLVAREGAYGSPKICKLRMCIAKQLQNENNRTNKLPF